MQDRRRARRDGISQRIVHDSSMVIVWENNGRQAITRSVLRVSSAVDFLHFSLSSSFVRTARKVLEKGRREQNLNSLAAEWETQKPRWRHEVTKSLGPFDLYKKPALEL